MNTMKTTTEPKKIPWTVGRVERLARIYCGGFALFIVLVLLIQYFGLPSTMGASRATAVQVWGDGNPVRTIIANKYNSCLEEALVGRGGVSVEGCLDVAASGQDKVALTEVLGKADHQVEKRLQAPLRWFLGQ